MNPFTPNKVLPAAVRRRWQLATARPDAGESTLETMSMVVLLVLVLVFTAFCGRLSTVQLDVDHAAHTAARAASMARTPEGAQAAAQRTVSDSLAHRAACRDPRAVADTGDMYPGGLVTVRVTCTVSLKDLGLLGVGDTTTITSTARSPIDLWRSS